MMATAPRASADPLHDSELWRCIACGGAMHADGDASRLFIMQVNLRFGCVILRHYLDTERGDLFMALGRYNGSRGQAAYPDAVLAARKQWIL